MKCKVCGKNAYSEYCFAHKPRKSLTNNGKGLKSSKKEKPVQDMFLFFKDIWNKRKQHQCENCGKWLGKEPLSYMFDHLLEKSKHPELMFEEDNIMLVCLECHDKKTRGFITEKIRAKIEKVKEKFYI